MIILSLSSGRFGSDSLYAISFIGGFLLFALLLVFLYFRRYEVGYVLDERGLTFYTPRTQYRKNTVVNLLVGLLALLSKRPAGVGGALLAQGRQSAFLKWRDVKEVRFYPKSKDIFIRVSPTQKIDICCTPDNYELVENFIRSKIKNVS